MGVKEMLKEFAAKCRSGLIPFQIIVMILLSGVVTTGASDNAVYAMVLCLFFCVCVSMCVFVCNKSVLY